MTWRERMFTPNGFLKVGGIVLLALGLLGFWIWKDPSGSFFWLDTSENIVHIAIGIVALAATFVPGLNARLRPRYRSIVLLIGLIALFFAVYGLLQPAGSPAAPNTFGLVNLELGDTYLNLFFAVWAFLSVYWLPGANEATLS